MISLSFDTDWMTSDAMEEFFTSYPELPSSTFFVHEHTKSISSDVHELNPHPTIDFSHGHKTLSDLENIIGKESYGIRSHSCVSSHLLSVEWANNGYKYQSIEVDLGNANLNTRALPWGLYEVPIYFMDNMSLWGLKNDLNKYFSGIDYIDNAMSVENHLVFDYHPLHIALNTSLTSDYAKDKDLVLNQRTNPWKIGNSGKGIRHHFEKALEAILNQRVEHKTLIQIVNSFERDRFDQ
jgi:hypothetical protein